MKTTSEQRRAMIGKCYVKGDSIYHATVHDIERSGSGFVVKYTTPDCKTLQYEGLQRFMKRFPHEIRL